MDKLIIFFSEIRWQDVVDIALNSYILFRLYVLFRGTNAFRVLMAIALLWFSQRVSVSLGLIVTSWAIQGIITVAALIIIVVFRKEIRSVLQTKKFKSLLWGLPRGGAQTPTEIIAESVFEMARRRVGSLIVLPGNDDLTEAVHSGIPWNGLVSKEMILSIFWHDNPVHDGAAIIQGDQVTEVGVVMPLSRREDLPSHYGTRHRAAAGLGEMTDALVIAVSEERGKVSVVKGSDIRVVSEKEEFQQILEAHAGVSSRQGGRTKREMVELVTAAAVSFILVAGIWFSFTRGWDTLMTLDVPIEYMNRDPGMEILDTSLNTVTLELSGSGALIRSIRPEQVKVRVDLNRAVAGPNAFAITPEHITLPPGIFLKNIKTPAVEVILDVPARKELPVQVDWTGKLPEHLIIEGVKMDPERVQVIGGKLALEKISTIYTEKVSVDRIEETGTMTVRLAINAVSLKISPGSKEKIAVHYVVKKRLQ